jgi:replicative DNA helicase
MASIVQVSEILKNENPYIVGSFGLDGFDELVGNINSSQLIVVGGNVGMGKTVFLSHVVATNIKNGKNIMFITGGDSNYNAWKSISKSYYSINRDVDKKENFEFIKDKLFFVKFNDDFDSLGELIESLLSDKTVDMVIIDNIQYFNIKNGNITRHNDQLRKIMHTLREWTINYKIPFLISSNVNRKNHYEPTVASVFTLRGSSEIEELSDTIIMIDRPEYWGIMEDVEGNSLIGVTELYVKKNRFGKTGIYKFVNKKTHNYSEINEIEVKTISNELINDKLRKLITDFDLEYET